MADIAVQASFNSGEWAPALNARVDIAKYKSGAALLENFFVDYRGGASTRPGTKYIIQVRDTAHNVRLIPFQASFNVGYILEFGDGYIRFIYQSSPVTETGLAITGATQANPCVITVGGNPWIPGDWIFITGVGGMTELNDRYFIVSAVAGAAVTLHDLFGNAVNSTGYGAYTSGGTAARIYTISSPYTSATDLRLLKFVQNVNQMFVCHPDHPTYVLTLVTAANWTMVALVIGSTAQARPTTATL